MERCHWCFFVILWLVATPLIAQEKVLESETVATETGVDVEKSDGEKGAALQRQYINRT